MISQVVTYYLFFFIQGLSNTPPIMEYFANENYVEDINEDNPLSMKGEIGKKTLTLNGACNNTTKN